MSDSKWGADAPMWRIIPPPLVPTDEDVELVQRACPPELLASLASPKILVLGVTPALVGAPWPEASEIHAVDYDQAMIEVLWAEHEHAFCHCARWQDMPFEDDTFDLVVGDCSFNALPGISDYDSVLREIARVSRPQAPLVARFFMQQQPRLELAALPGLVEREFAHFAPPARRLIIAIAGAQSDGSTHLLEIPPRIEREWGPVDEFLAAVGQHGDDFARIKRTLALDQRLNYPTREEIVARFEPYYPDIRFTFPDYDCGRFCPTVGFYPGG